jgi:UDP:flavonoid glycosyltransferase YjiC (YdhE family)
VNYSVDELASILPMGTLLHPRRSPHGHDTFLEQRIVNLVKKEFPDDPPPLYCREGSVVAGWEQMYRYCIVD